MAQKILIIDDDEGFVLAAGRMLEAAGYEVLEATDAAEARERLKSERPDLILLDVIMPGEDGFTFGKALAKDDRFSSIPVVLVTAVAEHPGQMMRAFEMDEVPSAADILPKSIVHERLLRAVESALGPVGLDAKAG